MLCTGCKHLIATDPQAFFEQWNKVYEERYRYKKVKEDVESPVSWDNLGD
jgi:hypothetical protein